MIKSYESDDLYIVVLDKGFVYIGDVSLSSDVNEEKMYVMDRCKNIRKWGTEHGLGELVNGPTENTILDNVGKLKFPNHALISLIHVDSKKWNKYL